MLIDRPTTVDLGRAVRAMREERRWTLETLATKAGVSDSTIGRIERAEISPTWAKVAAISFGLGVPVEELAAHAAQECFRRQSPRSAPGPVAIDRPGPDSSLE